MGITWLDAPEYDGAGASSVGTAAATSNSNSVKVVTAAEVRCVLA